jgi:hypothetical protein
MGVCGLGVREDNQGDDEMKTLFLLLLVSGMAWGQGFIPPVDTVAASQVIRWWVGVDTVDLRQERLEREARKKAYQRDWDMAIARSTTRLWQEYKDSCWADSAWERVHDMGNDTYCLMDFDCITSSHWKNKWTHKDPTFPGFMEFLTRRTK